MAIGKRYEILAPLGRGGMASVYRARDHILGRDVAVKLLPGRASAEVATRFEREAHALARLDHPGCVRILDVAPRGLVMELLDGESLLALVEREGRLDVSRALRIARGMVTALAHAHARGVLHRDIKPANVMLVGARVVLIDFGIARVRDEAAVTAAGTCMGSPSYVAPERLLGRGCDARADVYGVGVVLYELLAGVRPFVGKTAEDTMRLALHRPPRPLRALRSDVSPALDALVARALAKDPARRFADADELLAALDALDAPAVPLDDPASSSTFALLATCEPWWARLWARVRYGRWRWVRG